MKDVKAIIMIFIVIVIVGLAVCTNTGAIPRVKIKFVEDMVYLYEKATLDANDAKSFEQFRCKMRTLGNN